MSAHHQKNRGPQNRRTALPAYDGTSTYQYDAEGHLVGVTDGSFTWSGIYNALGWRVERSSSSAGRGEYVYGAAGTDLGNFNGGNGAWYEQYVPFEGRVLWYYNASGNVSRYFHVNALGSLGLATDQTGAPVEEMLYYPFGRGWQDSSGNWWDLKFARMQTEDVDLHMEMTPHRMNNPLLGRWMKADPMGGDVMNPQSLNRYAYVTNNPTTLNDPTGLDPYNPGDPCSDPAYAESHAECSTSCGFLNPEECPSYCNSLSPDAAIYCDCIEHGYCGYFYGAAYGDYGGGGGPVAPPAGQPPLAGVGASCGPFGCLGELPFQEEDPQFWELVWDAMKSGSRVAFVWALEHSPEITAYAAWCLRTHICSATTAKLTLSSLKQAGRATLNNSFGCADAPCIQKALKNIQRQQENGTWESGPRVAPRPKTIVPAGAH